MARTSGADLPREKCVGVGSAYIYGIDRTDVNHIFVEASVSPNTRAKDLADDEAERITAVVDETQMMEGDLRREVTIDTKRLQEIGCYHGTRHRKSLPVRDQKTRTNARTRKGLRKIVANKKKQLRLLQ